MGRSGSETARAPRQGQLRLIHAPQVAHPQWLTRSAQNTEYLLDRTVRLLYAMPGMHAAQPIPRLSPDEARILEAFLNPEATFLAIAAALKLNVQDLLDALAGPAIRAALDALAQLDALRRRLSLAPIVPGALSALSRLLDKGDNPAEVRRAATTILNTYTRLERTSRATGYAPLHALLSATPSPRVAGANGRDPSSPLGGGGRASRPEGAFSASRSSTGSTGQSTPARTGPSTQLAHPPCRDPARSTSIPRPPANSQWPTANRPIHPLTCSPVAESPWRPHLLTRCLRSSPRRSSTADHRAFSPPPACPSAPARRRSGPPPRWSSHLCDVPNGHAGHARCSARLTCSLKSSSWDAGPEGRRGDRRSGLSLSEGPGGA